MEKNKGRKKVEGVYYLVGGENAREHRFRITVTRGWNNWKASLEQQNGRVKRELKENGPPVKSFARPRDVWKKKGKGNRGDNAIDGWKWRGWKIEEGEGESERDNAIDPTSFDSTFFPPCFFAIREQSIDSISWEIEYVYVSNKFEQKISYKNTLYRGSPPFFLFAGKEKKKSTLEFVLKDNGKDESCLSVSDKVITVSLGSLRKEMSFTIIRVR